MKKTILALFLFVLICACSRTQQQNLGLLNKSPDETKVETRNPLVIPPYYNQRPAEK